MSCIAEGIPVPVITWLKDGVPLVDDSNVSDVRHIFIDPGTPTVFPMDVPEFGLIHSTLSLVDLILRLVMEVESQQSVGLSFPFHWYWIVLCKVLYFHKLISNTAIGIM